MNKKSNQNNGIRNRPDIDEDDYHLDGAVMEENQDREYLKMLPNQKGQSSNSYFLKASKYRGTTKQKKQEQEEQYNESDEEQQFMDQKEEDEQIQSQEQDGLKTAIKHLKSQRQKRSKLLQEDINAIDEQDIQKMKKLKQDDSQYGNPLKLKSQLSSFSQMVEVRVFSQKNIEQLKKYPVRNFQCDPACNQLMKQSEKEVLKGLGNLIYNYERVVEEILGENVMKTNLADYVNDTKVNDQTNKKLDVEQMWKHFSESTESITSKLEQGIVEWSQKTVLLKNSTSRSHYNSLVMQTPIGQAKKAIKDWQRVSKKAQMKRSPFRIFYEPEEDLLENFNHNIYDDIDLVQELQKLYEQSIETEDKEFLVNDTMKYIENRNASKHKKDVDRKASKNRKIRYNVHPKLLNFMPCSMENLLEAHQEIVRNLFNRGETSVPKQHEQIEYIDI